MSSIIAVPIPEHRSLIFLNISQIFCNLESLLFISICQSFDFVDWRDKRSNKKISWLKPLGFTYRGIIYCSKFEQRDGEHIFGEAEMIQSTISLLRSMNISQSCWIQNAHQCQRESNSVFSSFSHCRLFLIHPCLPPLLKQPENCQLYHNFYLLHWRVTPPPSICLVLVQYGLLVEERIYLNISRVIICNIPTRQFLSSGQVSAMLVSLRVKHRRWDAHTDCGQKHLCEYNENILVDLNCQLIVNLGSYSQGVWCHRCHWCHWCHQCHWCQRCHRCHRCQVDSTVKTIPFQNTFSFVNRCWKNCTKYVHLQRFCSKRH